MSPDTSSQLDHIEKARGVLMMSLRCGKQTDALKRLAADIDGLVQQSMDEIIDAENGRNTHWLGKGLPAAQHRKLKKVAA